MRYRPLAAAIATLLATPVSPAWAQAHPSVPANWTPW